MNSPHPLALSARYPLYLANAAVETGEWLEVTDKFHLMVVSEVAMAGAAQMEQAIVAAKQAESAMAKLRTYERQAVLRHAEQRFTQRFEELVWILVIEGGKPVTAARAEVKRLISTFALAADAVTQLDRGSVMPLDVTPAAGQYRGMVQRVPVGVCGLISPFNFPLNLAAHKVAPAIAAGCPFILKPASLTPISALVMGEVLAETDLPKGAFSILPSQRQAADQLVTDDRIRLLSFTGSDQVGWDMKARAGRKKVVLELGGNAVVMLEPDTDLNAAMERLITGAFSQAGQVCISVQRILVHHSIYETFHRLFLERVSTLTPADPALESTVIGPMIKPQEALRLKGWIDDAVAAGATLLCGGKLNGVMLEASVLENVPDHCQLYRDEAFGPVVILEAYDNFEQGLARMNVTRFGLQAGIYTQNVSHMLQAWDTVQVGGVVINDVPTFRVDNMPYGGVGDSGLGREGIRWAIQDMTEERLLVIRER